MMRKDMFRGDGHEPSPLTGASQDQVVAERLAQAVAGDPGVRVFNDLTLNHQGKQARIDHLVLHPHGIVLIESRSLHGELRVDRHGACYRYVQGRWVGISSPLHRLEAQQTLLMALLQVRWHLFSEHAAAPPGLLDGIEWHTLCVFPDTATLECDPRAPRMSMVAAANLGKRIHRLIGSGRGVGSFLLRPRAPRLGKRERALLGQFLQAQDAQRRSRRSGPAVSMVDAVTGARCSFPATLTPAFWQGVVVGDIQPIACRGCGTRDGLVDCYGRLGYFLKCSDCGVITPMNLACDACGDKALRVTRSGPVYKAQCRRCCFERVLFVAGG